MFAPAPQATALKKTTVEAELIEEVTSLAKSAVAIVKSLQAESYPSHALLEAPETTLKHLQAKSVPFTSKATGRQRKQQSQAPRQPSRAYRQLATKNQTKPC